MRRVLANSTLTSFETEAKIQWSSALILASMLWLTGEAEEAARVAEPVAAAPPRQINTHAVLLLSIRAAVAQPPERVAMLHALTVARASPELAADAAQDGGRVRNFIQGCR